MFQNFCCIQTSMWFLPTILCAAQDRSHCVTRAWTCDGRWCHIHVCLCLRHATCRISSTAFIHKNAVSDSWWAAQLKPCCLRAIINLEITKWNQLTRDYKTCLERSVPSHIQRAWKRARAEFHLFRQVRGWWYMWNLEQLDLSQLWLKPAGTSTFRDFKNYIVQWVRCPRK